jgi:hypothetical protein
MSQLEIYMRSTAPVSAPKLVGSLWCFYESRIDCQAVAVQMFEQPAGAGASAVGSVVETRNCITTVAASAMPDYKLNGCTPTVDQAVRCWCDDDDL